MNLFESMNKFFYFNELVELGNIFKDCEAYLLAVEHFDKALELSYLPINQNRLVEAYDCRGNAKIFLSNYRGAIIDYTSAIKIDSKDSYLFFWRGFAYEALQKYQEAIEDFKISLKIDPDFWLAKIMLDDTKKKI